MPTAPDLTERPRPPKRSWRQLPPSPPLGDPLPPPDPSALVEPLPSPVADEPRPVAPAPRRRRWPAVVAVLVVVALAAGGLAWWQPWASDAGAGTTTPTVPEADKGSPAAVARALGPAVVQLEVGGGGIGSGVVYDTAGLVLTAHHVVSGADELTVTLADGTQLPGRVVGRQADRDLAVVAVDADVDGGVELTAAPLADEGTVEVGEPVVALGSPYGFSQSVTAGIVSGLDRELEVPGTTLTGLIQTDAPINPGNSGGPLADADARVIGINTAIATASGGSDGVGFAIPVPDAQSILDQVAADGGVAAPTVPAPDQGGLGIPGLDDLFGGLDDLLGGGLDDLLGGGLDDLLGGSDLFGGILDQLLEELFGGALPGLVPDEGNGQGSSGIGSQEALALVRIDDLPGGYAQGLSRTATRRTDDRLTGTQQMVLVGPDGEIALVAERSDEARTRFDGLDGRAATVDGRPALRLDDGGLAWMADDDLLVVVTPEPGVPAADVAAVVEAVEVVR